MRTLHEYLGWTLIATNALAGVWALLAHRFDQPALRGRTFEGIVWLARGTVVVQVVLGIALMNSLGIDQDEIGFHLFYGVVAVISIAIGFIYLANNEWVATNEWLFAAALHLFVMGLGIRAVQQVTV